jgi:triosephosphate isomerase
LFAIPSYTALESACKSADSHLRIGAQNMCWEDEGQFTGEISPLMLKELGVRIVEIGHSERRHIMGETDEQENAKVLAALKHGFTALLCIGETQAQKEMGVGDEVLSMQLKIGLHGVNPSDLDRVWIAYEPVWAIGVSGIPATPDYAQRRHIRIKSVLEELFGAQADKVPVLYGGSVNLGNCLNFAELPEVDGLFVGRAAWQAERFNELIRAVLPVFKKKNDR